ncbi:MAG: TetR/AcrR family transcriptional regulator [Cumulibacter sp.]
MVDDSSKSWRELEEIQLSPILDAALQVFSEESYHGATVRTIAARAGVTVPLLYYHHKNKQGLLVDLFLRAHANLEERVLGAVADADGDALGEFTNLVEAMVIHTAGHVPFTRINNSLRHIDEDARRPILKIRRRIQQYFVDAVSKGVDEGLFSVPDPRAAALALAGMGTAIATWYHDDGPKSPQEIAVDYAEFARRLVGYRLV